MRDLRIFISYSHDDATIATALSNLLQQAFGPVLAEVFLDKSSIAPGASIKDAVTAALERADMLIAVMAGAQPASALSWPGFEIGRFSAFWEPSHYQQGPHRGRVRQGVIGETVVLTNGQVSLGPMLGQRPVCLGIPKMHLEADEMQLESARKAASVLNGEVLTYLRAVEAQVRNEPDYLQFAEARNESLADLVTDFKLDVFDALRNRVKDTSKPTRQLIVRTRRNDLSLGNDAKLFSIAGASELFGKSEGGALFKKKAEEEPPGSTRYEARWSDFKASVRDNQHGAYWCSVIEQAVLGATKEDHDLDANLVFTSHRDQRFRVIATTVTIYFNDDVEVSLHLIEILRRPEHGSAETTKLLNCLNVVCRFRFAFLEGTSPYYWLNFSRSSDSPKGLLMELDYLKSEAIRARLGQPGAYEEFMTSADLADMMRVWIEVDASLRRACGEAVAQQSSEPLAAESRARIVEQLKLLAEGVKPFNLVLGAAASERLLAVFNHDRMARGALVEKANDDRHVV